jgi:UDP-N-acetyl-D-mannosaminuronate dehydrogenase
VEPQILANVDISNEARALNPLDKIEGRKVLVLGISYKEGVNDERGSQTHRLISNLKHEGYNVTAIDGRPVKSGSSRYEFGHDTVIVTIPEPGFRNIGKIMGQQVKVVLDFANIVNPRVLPAKVRLWQAGRGWAENDID